MIKKAFLGAAFLLCAVLPGFSAGVDLTIRFYDKKVYFTDGDPIYIQVTLNNNSPSVYRFRMADDHVFSLDFDVRTMKNRPVEAAEVLLRRRGSSSQVFFRDISIESGESFSFIENLRDYAALNATGVYVVQARLYPELYKNNAALRTGAFPAASQTGQQTVNGGGLAGSGGSGGLTGMAGSGGNAGSGGSGGSLSSGGNGGGAGSNGSNGSANTDLLSARLTLNIRTPLLPAEDGLPQALDLETNAILVRDRLPPDEVIAFMLTARQKSQWEKFFLYLDLEQMLLRDAARERRWRVESEEGRRRMLERFRSDLQSSTIDGDISSIPSRFDIERTTYNAGEGTVIVLERFRQGDYTEKKRYTYHLRKTDDVWTVIDYVVINLGTE